MFFIISKYLVYLNLIVAVENGKEIVATENGKEKVNIFDNNCQDCHLVLINNAINTTESLNSEDEFGTLLYDKEYIGLLSFLTRLKKYTFNFKNNFFLEIFKNINKKAECIVCKQKIDSVCWKSPKLLFIYFKTICKEKVELIIFDKKNLDDFIKYDFITVQHVYYLYDELKLKNFEVTSLMFDQDEIAKIYKLTKEENDKKNGNNLHLEEKKNDNDRKNENKLHLKKNNKKVSTKLNESTNINNLHQKKSKKKKHKKPFNNTDTLKNKTNEHEKPFENEEDFAKIHLKKNKTYEVNDELVDNNIDFVNKKIYKLFTLYGKITDTIIEKIKKKENINIKTIENLNVDFVLLQAFLKEKFEEINADQDLKVICLDVELQIVKLLNNENDMNNKLNKNLILSQLKLVLSTSMKKIKNMVFSNLCSKLELFERTSVSDDNTDLALNKTIINLSLSDDNAEQVFSNTDSAEEAVFLDTYSAEDVFLDTDSAEDVFLDTDSAKEVFSDSAEEKSLIRDNKRFSHTNDTDEFLSVISDTGNVIFLINKFKKLFLIFENEKKIEKRIVLDSKNIKKALKTIDQIEKLLLFIKNTPENIELIQEIVPCIEKYETLILNNKYGKNFKNIKFAKKMENLKEKILFLKTSEKTQQIKNNTKDVLLLFKINNFNTYSIINSVIVFAFMVLVYYLLI